jgi:hypothetical protein
MQDSNKAQARMQMKRISILVHISGDNLATCMQHEWGKRETPIGCWWESQKEEGH